MKDLLLLIVAIVLFLLLGAVAYVYTCIYYLFNEKDKQRTQAFKTAYAIDVFANMTMGEFFELFFSVNRGVTLFGDKYSLSCAIGHEMTTKNFKEKYRWFSMFLDFVFNEKDHCVNAYNFEKLNIKK